MNASNQEKLNNAEERLIKAALDYCDVDMAKPRVFQFVKLGKARMELHGAAGAYRKETGE